MQIDLIWIASLVSEPPGWSLGEVRASTPAPRALAAAVASLPQEADFILFWDETLGRPDTERISSISRMTGDVWHAGLCLGMNGLPRAIDFVDPVWRLNRDPAGDQVATSWRLSLRACLARRSVLEALGGPDANFDTLAGASLELGHRWIRHGAMMRHVPDLLPGDFRMTAAPPGVSLNDEFRFLRLRYGRVWAAWAGWRMARHGLDLSDVIRAYRRRLPACVQSELYLHPSHEHYSSIREADSGADRGVTRRISGRGAGPPTAVTVLIPTVDRYPHLFNLLDQLRHQTAQPGEIIVVDQTEMARRDVTWPERFPDLPLRVIRRDEAGQCSSRNAGLQAAVGEMILFLDDDDEIPADLIARHLEFLERFEVDASCGVAEETGAGALPPEFTLIRDSDVFPTNNTLVRTAALHDSGLFDLAYERGERADGDLGMRLYLCGKQLALNPLASVVHLHAPRGGLRLHEARVVTRSASRATLTHRHLLAPTEGYLWSRYFSDRQVNEALLIRTVGTLRGRQRGIRRFLRAGLMAVLLPDTWRKNRTSLTIGRNMLKDYPSIPYLEPADAEEFVTV